MLKKFYRYAALLLTVLTVGGLASCNDDDPEATPSIEIKNTTPAETSISFRLVPHDATSYGYAVVTADDYKAKNYQFTIVNSGEENRYTVDNLETKTTYYVVAVAYNGGLTSEEKSIRTATGTLVELATVEMQDFKTTENTASGKLVASTGTSYLRYAIYNEGLTPEESSWKELDVEADEESGQKLYPEGNYVYFSDLMPGDYVIEAVPYMREVEGEHLYHKFTLEIVGRAYVSSRVSNVTYKDATVELKKNKECSEYYLGIVKKSEFDAQAILNSVNAGTAGKRVKEDYNGSLKELIGAERFDAWVAETDVCLWFAPCDLEGKVSQDPAYILKNEISIPKRTYTFNGKGKVTLKVDAVDQTSYTAMVTATDSKAYYLLYGSKAELAELLPTQNNVLDSMMKRTPLTEMEKTFQSTKLQPNTEYIIYAIAEDENNELGKLVKEEVKTLALAFDSNASVEVATKEVSFENLTVTFTPQNGCTAVRYVLLTSNDYLVDYKGIFTQIENALALNQEAKAQVLNLTEATDVTFRNLTSNQQYLLFALPLDAQGAMGHMSPELPIKTARYELTSSVTAEITNIRVTGVDTKRVRFRVTPSEGCKSYYVRFVSDGLMLTDNQLVSKLMQVGGTDGSIRVYDENGGDAPAQNFDMNVYGKGAVYILCQDADNKFNNPRVSPEPIPVK